MSVVSRMSAALAVLAALSSPALAATPKVVTSTEDLAALVREVGGDKVTVDAIARGYQDPHFVDPKPSLHGRKNCPVARVVAIAFPALERERLSLTETERRFHLVDPHRQIGAEPRGACRLVPDEAAGRPDRSFAPDDNDAPGGLQMPEDGVAPFLAGRDVRVPPDRLAIGFQCADQRYDARPVLGLVGQEDFTHRRSPSRTAHST